MNSAMRKRAGTLLVEGALMGVAVLVPVVAVAGPAQAASGPAQVVPQVQVDRHHRGDGDDGWNRWDRPRCGGGWNWNWNRCDERGGPGFNQFNQFGQFNQFNNFNQFGSLGGLFGS